MSQLRVHQLCELADIAQLYVVGIIDINIYL